ncbi:MAG: 1-deoxy-D-xylulose-5-phosphate reductoisomerase [Candidatus Omnitrophica bacterium]|nr:1-deoxy-D-xylulose-5-phosphate reductoisomerase [Candidatus Omnitrophota bacterium]MCF7877391.1 1-deoxy-D-xylulose-5-phosphate reductoisomerase [Candidatus Omnitrophota bacterium]MCF7878824.1 1-deoxy-D-xylulose-5-phosphate reductoisomerase [Candidatus Omnitrophota bacterium]MCF7893216.1 1-deoxy-D-xylulose-5-phosphate reductoisomerase [Candidatus Omnitrophota bacterium]
MKKKVLVFGSTGSVGKNSLEIIGQNKDKFEVVGVCGNKNVNQLIKQIREFRPKYVCLKDQDAACQLKKRTKIKFKLFSGKQGLADFSSLKSDISIMAISGIDCLRPLLINIEKSQRIALANKEAIVAGAKFIFKKAKKHNTEIIPVDSEINAIFQLLKFTNLKQKDLEKIYITASGGALLNYDKKSLSKVSAAEVLNHPTWEMGQRITVDSATLVNKGFEVVEAHNFFNIDYEKIEILLHRQSLIHAMVKLNDQTCFSCLYPPDMKKPISFALFYPRRKSLPDSGKHKKEHSFSYRPVAYKKFPLLKIILDAAKRGDNSLIILNACDELVVNRFLDKKIKFIQIEKTLKKIFKIYPSKQVKSIKDVYFWDSWARKKTKEILGEK